MFRILAISLLLAAASPAHLTIEDQAFAESDILDARGLPEVGGGASILITLTPEAAPRLAALTRAHVGETLTVAIDGATVAEPRVMEEIAGGALQVTGAFSLADAIAMARRISGKDPAPDSLEE